MKHEEDEKAANHTATCASPEELLSFLICKLKYILENHFSRRYEKRQPDGPPTIRARLEYALDMHGSGLAAEDLMILWIRRQANATIVLLKFVYI